MSHSLDFEVEFESDSDIDEERDLQELEQLNALLQKEEALALQCLSSQTNVANIMAPEDRETYNHLVTSLELNKKYDDALLKLERKLVSDLHEIRFRLKEIHKQPVRSDKSSDFSYRACTRPYFKNPDNIPPPDNIDTILMKQAGMFDFSEITAGAGWTVKDKTEFLQEILKNTIDIRKNELLDKLSELLNKQKRQDSKELKSEISAVMQELESVTKKTLEEITMPLDYEFDWEAIAIELCRRHTANEYRSIWKLFLHPSINKDKWCKSDHTALLKIIQDFNFQDWDLIAKTLNTNRSGYQCFVYFKTNMGINPIRKWTRDEEETLLSLIEFYRMYNYIPWAKVASQMKNRTKIQIYNKYLRLMELKKGRFLPEEDAIILTCLSEFGPNFKKIRPFVPGRSIAQIRSRVHTLKNEPSTSTVWTVAEDKKLIQLMANQDSNINFSVLTPYFSGKDRNQLRARYVTLSKWMKNHPNKDIANAPRRGARRLGHGRKAADINEAIENLKKRIETDVPKKKLTKITKDSPEEVIEECIDAILITEHVRMEEMEQVYESKTTSADLSIEQTIDEKNLNRVLVLLSANLDKKKFLASKYHPKYARLAQDHINLTVNVKSYSKLNMLQSLHVDRHFVNIWGSNTLANTAYVLPPNLNTLTGCKIFLTYMSTKPQIDTRIASMQTVSQRNEVFKMQLELFRARFRSLFLWPIILSNHDPFELNLL